MSTKQSIGETQTQTAPAVTAHSQVDITQQTTTPTATTQCEKNVTDGKLVAERTKLAREQQKKALPEASIILASKVKATTAAPEQAPEPAPEPAPTTEGGEKNRSLSTTEWLMVGSIVVGLVGSYYKREELKVKAKAVFGEKKNA